MQEQKPETDWNGSSMLQPYAPSDEDDDDE